MQTTDLAHASRIIFGMDPMLLSSAILIVSYIILFTEKLNRAVVAMLGAAIMIWILPMLINVISEFFLSFATIY